MGWWLRLLSRCVAILPFGAAIIKERRIIMEFPTEKEADEYAKELEEQDNENRTEPKSGCNSNEQ